LSGNAGKKRASLFNLLNVFAIKLKS